mgnify:CR=1 FL=1
MPWISGALIADPAAGQVLVSRLFTSPDHCFVVVAVSSQAALETFLQLMATDGVTVKAQLPIPVSGGLYVTPRLGPITVDKNEMLRVINRNALPAQAGEEVQASLFIEP